MITGPLDIRTTCTPTLTSVLKWRGNRKLTFKELRLSVNGQTSSAQTTGFLGFAHTNRIRKSSFSFRSDSVLELWQMLTTIPTLTHLTQSNVKRDGFPTILRVTSSTMNRNLLMTLMISAKKVESYWKLFD